MIAGVALCSAMPCSRCSPRTRLHHRGAERLSKSGRSWTDSIGLMSDQLTHPATGERFPSPIPPGTGWPGDLATDATPVATDAPDVARLAAGTDLAELTARSSVCRACPRLVAWREEVALMKRRSFASQPYWGRPVAGRPRRQPDGPNLHRRPQWGLAIRRPVPGRLRVAARRAARR